MKITRPRIRKFISYQEAWSIASKWVAVLHYDNIRAEAQKESILLGLKATDLYTLQTQTRRLEKLRDRVHHTIEYLYHITEYGSLDILPTPTQIFALCSAVRNDEEYDRITAEITQDIVSQLPPYEDFLRALVRDYPNNIGFKLMLADHLKTKIPR